MDFYLPFSPSGGTAYDLRGLVLPVNRTKVLDDAYTNTDDFLV